MPWKTYRRKKVQWGYAPRWVIIIKKSLEEDMRELGFTEEEIKKAVEKHGARFKT